MCWVIATVPVKHLLEQVPPCQAAPCPAYSSVVSVNQMLELPAGQAKTLGIRVGDRLTIESVAATPQPK